MTGEPPQRSIQATRQYWLRLLRVFVVALVFALVLLPLLLGVFTMWGLMHPPCNPGTNPGGFNPNYESVTFSSVGGLEQAGYFIPGTNGATIIVVPAYSSGRGAELHYAQVFNRAGFNVFTLNSRVCTTHGWISLGYQETQDVRAAYDYLVIRPDVDAARVSLHGFSSGGATAIMSAAQMPEIRSVSAEGGYHDFPSAMGVSSQVTYFDGLYQVGMRIVYRLVSGDDIQVLSPISMLDRLSPRPLLLVYGSLESSLPGARQMLGRAQELGLEAELWVVEGAWHGNYIAVAPDEFAQRVVGFHRDALLGTE